MTQFDRRDLLKFSSLGVAAGAGGLLLGGGIGPTASSGGLGAYAQEVAYADSAAAASGSLAIPAAAPPKPFAETEDNILGPYHRRGAPFRAKITPPLEPGEPLVVRGRVWGADSRRPLTGAMLDIWQANAAGQYDNDDPRKPPKDNVFVNRARLVVDESGYYEYETIKPGRYAIGRDRYRPAHIHYLVRAAGYKPLVTQMYFRGDPMNSKDDFIKDSLIVDLNKVKVGGGAFELATFDIVLAKA